MSLAHLLVVDDDVTASPLLKAALRADFRLSSELSGAKAISTAGELRPDAILLDLHMPNVDGFEVLRQLKRDPGTSSIPVICMSGATDQSSRDRAAELGAAGYFQKPLDVRRLGEDLKSLLSSMNSRLETPGRMLRFTLAFNHGEKYRILKEDLRAQLSQGAPCLVLSLMNGEDFAIDDLKEPLVRGEFVFLQVTPSLISKIPYLLDLSPITDDIQGFLPRDSHEYSLFIDDPQLLLGSDDPKAAFGRIHSLKELFSSRFKRASLYASREGAPETVQNLNEIAVIFCR